MGAVAASVVMLAGCTSTAEEAQTPGLEARGTVLTTVTPTRQDLTNQISLSGKVTIDPVFGIGAPHDGELRWMQRAPQTTAATQPVWVATVWKGGAQHRVSIPKGSIMAGRLMAEKSTVTEGMPVVSARHVGYGIVATIDSAQAYRISGAIESVKAQIKDGPGPFSCTAIGSIAAMPAGSIPAPEPTATATKPAGGASAAPPVEEPESESAAGSGSEATGMQLVCKAPKKIKMINGTDVTLDVVTGTVEKAMVLPVEAVAGSQGKGKVDVVVGEERTRKTVDVVLGMSDGKVVEIKKGLTGTETIAVPGPNLPAPEAETQEGTG